MRPILAHAFARLRAVALSARAQLGPRILSGLVSWGWVASALGLIYGLWTFLNWYIVPQITQDRKDLITTLAQILAGVVVLVGLYFTRRTVQLNQEGQVTERFTRAIDQLGATDAAGNPRL